MRITKAKRKAIKSQKGGQNPPLSYKFQINYYSKNCLNCYLNHQ